MRPLLAVNLDTSFGQITADLLLIIAIAANAYAGWRQGLVRRALAFAGLYAAVLAGNYLGNALGGLFSSGDRLTANTWAFVLVFVGTMILVEIMAALYNDNLQSLIVVTFDRVAGVVAGVVIGILEIGILFAIAIAAGNASPPSVGNTIPHDYHAARDAIQSATLGEYVAKLDPGIKALFGPALPNDLTNHLSEGTTKAQ